MIAKKAAKMEGEKPSKPITVAMLGEYIDNFGKDNMMVTLIPVEGGYSFRTSATYGHTSTKVIQSERSRKVRVFKTVESALNLARKFGFLEVAIELQPSETITKRYARTGKAK